MSTSAVTIAYFDESQVWPLISHELQRRNPVRNVEFKEYDLAKIYLEFPVQYVPHSSAHWGTSLEDSYKKPFVWIYLLVSGSFDHYKREVKNDLKKWINNMTEERIEWLVLYIPCASDFDKSHNKQFARTFERISAEISTLVANKYKCARLYSASARAFLNLRSPMAAADEYWEEFFSALRNSLSLGIQDRITYYLEQIIKYEDAGDFYLYCLAKEGMAIVHQLCKLNIHAKECYDELRAPSEIFNIMEFMPVSEDDMNKSHELSVDEFREAMLTGNISELAYREYVFNRQKLLLQEIGEYAKIGELALNFVSMCMRLFSCLPEQMGSQLGNVWIYKVTYKLGQYLQDRIPQVQTTEMKSNVHYAIGLLLSIARSRLERMGHARYGEVVSLFQDFTPDLAIDKSPVRREGPTKTPNTSLRENEEPEGDWPLSDTSSYGETDAEEMLSSISLLENKLLELASSLCEEQSKSGYNRVADRYKAEFGIMLSLRGQYDQASSILATLDLSKWPQLNNTVLKHALQCHLNTQRRPEALETALNILKNKHLLSEDTELQLWRCVEELSLSLSLGPVQCPGLFEASLTTSHSKAKQGDRVELACFLFNSLSCAVSAVQVFVEFANDSSRLVVSALNAVLSPGSNEFILTGVASALGRLVATRLIVQVNNAELCVTIRPHRLIVEEQDKYARIKQKAPCLVVLNEVQLLAIEVLVRSTPISDCCVKFLDPSLLYNDAEAQFLLYNAEGSSCSYTVDIQDKCVKLPDLPANSRAFVIVEIQATALRGSTLMNSPRPSLADSFMSTSAASSSREALSRRLNPVTQEHRFEVHLYYSVRFAAAQKCESCANDLKYLQPLSVTCKLLNKKGVHVLQATLLNCAHVSLKLNQFVFTGCEVLDNPTPTGLVIRTGQQVYLAAVLTDLVDPELVIHYVCVPHNKEPSGRVHIEASIDHKMRCHEFTHAVKFMPQDVVEMRHANSGVVGEQFTIHLSFFRTGTVTIRVDTSHVWRVPPPFEGKVEDELELQLVPMRNGPWDIPEIFVWMDDRQLQVHGTRRVMCYPKGRQPR